MKKTIIIFIIILVIFGFVYTGVENTIDRIYGNNEFVILTNPDNVLYNQEIIDFGKKNDIKISFVQADDLEAIDYLEDDSTRYDAVWLSNSTWLYMLDGVTTLNSKSININPIVFGVKKSKAQELGFVNKQIYNKDIVNAIKDGKLKYIMSSVTKSNTGLTAYLGFLNALAGSPEVLTKDMLKAQKLKDDMVTFFSGVERVSGNDSFLRQMFLNSDEYEAVIANESFLININLQLEKSGKEPLYLLYPVDGVAINDSPFAYIDNKQNKLDKFNLIQQFLLSKVSQKKLEDLGKRTWYGGINENANPDVFKKDWGIDTTKYLTAYRYPSKAVMNEAINLYIDVFRKPSVTAFCLDYSGSMIGSGETELESAMSYILDYEQAKEDRLQFSEKDVIIVLPFSDNVSRVLETKNGRQTSALISSIYDLSPFGGTNLYGCAAKAVNLTSEYSDKYTKTVILMTDGEANIGSFNQFRNSYQSTSSKINERIPVYSIMFGAAKERQLQEIAELTNSKVFDGKTDLKTAFKEVRSFN